MKKDWTVGSESMAVLIRELREVVSAGADLLIAGTYVFKNEDHPSQVIQELKNLVVEANWMAE